MYISGKMVKFDSDTINGLFKLPNIPHDEYNQYIEHYLNLDDILAYLIAFITIWKFSIKGSVTFNSKAITYEDTKVWYYFLMAH